MSRPADQRGAALVSVILLATALLPLGAWLAVQAQLDCGIAGSLRNELQAFYAAEAGLAQGVATLHGLHSAAEAMAGPDGVANTGDDGLWWGAAGTRLSFPGLPSSYSLSLERIDGELVRIRSFAYGPGPAAKELEAIVRWQAGRVQYWYREIL